MIGENYWTTGIIVDFSPAIRVTDCRYHAHLFFRDHGLGQDGTTAGKLLSLYYEKDLGAVLDTLIADAKKLGIVFDRNGEKPMLYAENDGESPANMPEGWLEELQAQARRLGWTTYYMDEDAAEAPAMQPAAS